MVTGCSDLGYQMRLDPKYTSTEAIRRLSANDIQDIDKLYRSKTYITLAQPPETTFKVKGKSFTGEDEKASSLRQAQASASALCIKSDSASPSVRSTKSTAKKRRDQSEATPREQVFKSDEKKKLFINNTSLKQETKLPQIKTIIGRRDDNNERRYSEKHKTFSVSGKNVGSWSLSQLNQHLLEIDMSGFAPFGEYGYFSAYGVKGQQAYTSSEKLSNINPQRSEKQLKVNLKLPKKFFKTNLGLDFDRRTTTSGLSRSYFPNKSARANSLRDFSAETKEANKLTDKKDTLTVKHADGSAKQKTPVLPGNLNLSRSKTCLVLPSDSPRGVFIKRKRGSKDIYGSKESLASITEETSAKTNKKTTSTQTKSPDISSHGNNLIDTSTSVINDGSPRRNLHGQGGILYSPACFETPLIPDSTSKRVVQKSASQNTTPRMANAPLVGDIESNMSDDDAGFKIEVSIGRNVSNQRK